jgi:hypothetical protein
MLRMCVVAVAVQLSGFWALSSTPVNQTGVGAVVASHLQSTSIGVMPVPSPAAEAKHKNVKT